MKLKNCVHTFVGVITLAWCLLPIGLCQDPTDIYRGCYIDDADRVMTDLISCTVVDAVCQDSCGPDEPYCESDSGMTIDACRILCQDKNFQYYGLEGGNQCFCGGSFSDPFLYGSLVDGMQLNCSDPCTGNANQTCGGEFRLKVYEFQDPHVDPGCFFPRSVPYASVIDVGVGVGETLTFTCKPGYEMVGESTLTCMSNRTWSSDAVPVCNYTGVFPATTSLPLQTTRSLSSPVEPLTTSSDETASLGGDVVTSSDSPSPTSEQFTIQQFTTPVLGTEQDVHPNGAVLIVSSVLSTLLVIIVLAFVCCAVWIRKKREADRNTRAVISVAKPDTTNRTDYEVTILPQGFDVTSTVYEDVGLPSWAARWIIPWSGIVIDEQVLGRGAFGEVRSGAVRKGRKITKSAIKMLKGHASQEERADFMEEFRTMTSIGYHPNVVSLLGACQYQDVLYVAVEYLPNGDLRSHLRAARPQSDADEGALSSDQLVQFAFDVAKGMKHLAISGVIHRDLAARNILLGEGLVAKVSDFGLSRGEDIYLQTSKRRVPTRWLAIESLMHQTYTTKSDVWSFGILLWEIASLGGTPYPSIDNKSLAGKLREGYRMDKPSNCDDEIYDLMLQCWDEDPNRRPSFADLILILNELKENQIKQTYFVVDRSYYENFVIRPEFDDN